MCVELFLVLLLGHVLGDFYLQNDKICKDKRERHFASKWTYLHPIVVAAVSFLLVWNVDFWYCALVLLASHFVIDIIKSYLKDNVAAFVIDQFFHVCVLAAVCMIWEGGIGWGDYLNYKGHFLPEYILALLILGKPSNIVIKKVLAEHKLQETGTNRIGALIGSLERVIAFLLIVAGQFSAVGFLVTAKSVLRFKDSQTEKSEYVLAGTLLSFGLAVAVGMVVHYHII